MILKIKYNRTSLTYDYFGSRYFHHDLDLVQNVSSKYLLVQRVYTNADNKMSYCTFKAFYSQ